MILLKKTFYITTPLYYVNASPHIGHSYTEIACDCLARYHRMKGEDTFFLTGTDEHGQKILRCAQEKKVEVCEFTDSVAETFKQLWKRLDISYDDFIRTTQPRHHVAVKKVLSCLYDKGDIYESEYKGFYCTPCETFWTKAQLENGACPDCKRNAEEILEKNYFFKLSKYQDWLIGYIKENPNFIRPEFRRNEVSSFLKEELNDLCISRPRSRLSWGIEIPFASDHVTYVWFDALINYISGCGWLDNSERFKKFWPADIHMIGKDILRQHAVYWPIILHALDIEPPKTIFAHGWWLVGQEKMSKSKGNMVDPLFFIEKYGTDAYRYFLMKEAVFGLDGTFQEEAFIARFNSDLANDLGNLLNRTLSMAAKYFAGIVPDKGNPCEADELLRRNMKKLPERIDSLMLEFKFNEALSAVWEVVNSANKHIELSAPWQLAKNNDKKRLESVIYLLLEVLSYAAFIIYPFMPQAALNMISQLGLGLSEKDMTFETLNSQILIPGKRLNNPIPIFPRIIE